MSSIRSELNAQIDSENRSRSPLSAGLLHILMPICLSICAVVFSETMSAIFPAYGIIFKTAVVFFIGTRWRALGNIIHECAHGIFVDKPKHNEILGHLLSSIEFTDFNLYCKHHQTHHAHLGDPDHDLDFKARHTFLGDHTPSKRQFIITILSAVSLFPLWAKQARPVLWSGNIPFWANFFMIHLLAITLVGLLYAPTSSHIFLYGILPFATSYQWMRLFSDCADHIFLYNNQNEVDRSRNHIFQTSWLNALLFPRNDAYHLVHHLFPNLPTRSYPIVHARFLNNAWYARKSHTLPLLRGGYRTAELESQGQSR